MSVDFSAMFAAKAKAKAQPAVTATVRAPAPATLGNQSAASEGKTSKKKKRKHNNSAANAADGRPPSGSSSSSNGKGNAATAAAKASASAHHAPAGDKRARKMSEQLAGAQFRYINETLYTRPSEEAVTLFAEEPALYEAYHVGFRLQAARWPLRPVQALAQWLTRSVPHKHVVADLGCGDAELAASVPQTVHSFDLVAANERVVACDIANVPLPTSSVHVAVFCLALMGSNFAAFLAEAHRLLKPAGILKIAEVSSRIDDADGWRALLHALGFDLTSHDASNSHFVLYEYAKSARKPEATLPPVRLKACQYKKR